MSLKHSALVEYASKFLRNAKKCSVVITEMASGAAENPDAVGWTSNASHLIECKATRPDFRSDTGKHFRQFPHHAMGDYRWYLVNPGVTSPDGSEMPPGWGLLLRQSGLTHVLVEATRVESGDRAYERQVLCSAIRRLIGTPGVRGVRCKPYIILGKGDPRATIGGMDIPKESV